MKYDLACEHFELTDAIRSQVEDSLNHAEALIPPEERVHVMLSQDPPRQFRALMRVHSTGKDIVATSEGGDLYAAIRKASGVLKNRLAEARHKKVDRRRRMQAL